MSVRTLIAFTVAAGAVLLAAAAFAQETDPPHVDMPAGAQPLRNNGVTIAESPLPGLDPASRLDSPVAPTALAADVSAQLAAAPQEDRAESNPAARAFVNLPVFDTPETRALYPPLSAAGRATIPAGN